MEAGRILASNLKYLRKTAAISQTELARLSEVPRSTIANIESESGNPSLGNLVRLANALKVNIDELLTQPRSQILVQKVSDIPVIEKSGGRAIVQKLLPDPIKGMEIDRVRLKPQSRMKGVPHTEGTKEYLTVLRGKVVVNVSGESYQVEEGEVISFPGDQAHSYFNPTGKDSRFMSIVVLAPRY